MLLRFAAPMVIAAVGLCLPVGCGGDADAFCDAKCACDVCNEPDYERCLYDYDADAAQAERLGCFEYYDAYAACIESVGCFDDRCKHEKDRWHDCRD